MIKKVLFFSILCLSVVKGYKYLEKKLLKDKEYLLDIVNKRRTLQNTEILTMTLNQAKSLAENEDYESSIGHYIYAFKDLGCEWDFMMSFVENEAIKTFLESQKSILI